MISAIEARLIAKENDQELMVVIDKINALIKLAAYDGKFSINYFGETGSYDHAPSAVFIDKVMSKLKQSGYFVSWTNNGIGDGIKSEISYSPMGLHISW